MIFKGDITKNFSVLVAWQNIISNITQKRITRSVEQNGMFSFSSKETFYVQIYIDSVDLSVFEILVKAIFFDITLNSKEK